MDNEKSPLYIPMGIREEAEIFPGFGKAELFKALAVVALFVIIDAVVFLLTGSVEAVIIILVLGAAVGIGLFTKDGMNTSMADRLAEMLRFSRNRKKYPYIMKDEWGIEP